MKSFFIVFIIPIIFLSAQTHEDYFNKLIETENAFSDRAAVIGIRNSFLEFIADDGILFRPTAVNGKNFLLNQKNSSSGILQWYPEIASLSKSKDFGFTTGPWEFRKHQDSAAVAYGNFATIWELQDDGTFKFAIDIGNNNDKPNYKIDSIPFKRSIQQFSNIKIEHGNKNIIIDIDKKFNSGMNNKDYIDTYFKFSDEKTRLFRDGLYPISGIDPITQYANTIDGELYFTSIDGEISLAGDLGYTYGLIEKQNPSDNPTKFNYVRFWLNKTGNWKLAIEVLNQISN